MVKENALEFIAPRANSVFIPLNSIRLKVTDRCKWNCWWCHNEGSGIRDPEKTMDIIFENDFSNTFLKVCSELDIDEVHLTGGEPTQHRGIVEIIKYLKNRGFKVKMTSVGNRKEIMDEVYKSGIDSINFSLHAIDTDELLSTQIDRTYGWMIKQHEYLLESIIGARDNGINIKINTVMASEDDETRVRKVINWANGYNIDVRILHEVNNLEKSINAVRKFLESMGAEEEYRKYIVGSSSGTIMYSLHNGKKIGFKVLIPNYLSTMCNNCLLKENNQCGEYFYGIRLENHQGNYIIRLCTHKTTNQTYIPIYDFASTKQFEEIRLNAYNNKKLITI